jgi:alcohol dehydrogenase class IV
MRSMVEMLIPGPDLSDERTFELDLVGRRLVFGNGTVRCVAALAGELGASHVLVVADIGVVGAGLLDRVLGPLRADGLRATVFDDVAGEPTWATARAAGRQAREARCDAVIGLGGGSAMDVAKAASILATLDEPVAAYWAEDRWLRALPKILIPTSAGTGSELSSAAVFTDVDGYKKAMRGSKVGAEVAVVDPLLTLTLPPRPTADSGMDALVHAIEGYTSRRGSPFGDIFAERAIELIGLSLTAAHRDGSDVAARYRMALASTMAGVAAQQSGVGAVHALTYPLSTTAQISHGLANALLLPDVVAYNLPANLPRYCEVARLLGEPVEGLSLEVGADRCVDVLTELRATLEMPSRLRDVGVEQAAFPGFVEYAFTQFARNLEANARPLSHADALAIYRAAW